MELPEATSDSPALVLPDEMTPAIREVLGNMVFTTCPIAHLFAEAGHKIEPRAEDEQAFVLFRWLKLAIAHGDQWKIYAGAEIDDIADEIKAKKP